MTPCPIRINLNTLQPHRLGDEPYRRRSATLPAFGLQWLGVTPGVLTPFRIYLRFPTVPPGV